MSSVWAELYVGDDVPALARQGRVAEVEVVVAAGTGSSPAIASSSA